MFNYLFQPIKTNTQIMMLNHLNFDAIRLTGIIIIGLLILATLIIYSLSFCLNKPLTELKSRMNSWWIMSAFFLMAIFINSKFSIILFACISFLALKEYFTLIHTRLEDHRILLWAYLAIPLQYLLIFTQWKEMVWLFIPVYVFLFMPFRRVLTGYYEGIVESMGKIQWGLIRDFA